MTTIETMRTLRQAGTPQRHPMACLGIGFGAVVGAAWGAAMLVHTAGAGDAASSLASAAAGLAAYVVVVRRFERRAVVELATAPAMRELAAGLAIGAMLFAMVVALLAASGVCRVDGWGDGSSIAPVLAVSIASGVVEELVFRGLLFRIVEAWRGTWVAMAVSAVLFGIVHWLSPNATWQGVVAIVVEAGILLCAAYLATRRLWLPIGMHIAWNFTQGGVFGIAVSGHPMSGLVRGALDGPEWLTGGAFGAEASPIAAAIGLVAALVLLRRARRVGATDPT